MKNLLTTLTAIGIIASSFACSDNDDPTPVPDAKPIELKAGMDRQVTQDNDFAFELFRKTYNTDKNQPNIFISPFSINSCLSMALNGAKGETLTEMQTALRISDFSTSENNDYRKTLREGLLKVDPSTQLGIANSVWSRNDFSLKEDFKEVNKANYGAEIKDVDFKNPTTLKAINDWCAKNTNNKIPQIIDEISDEAVMYLINAVYFKGMWRNKFNQSNTSEKDFYAEGETAKVQMMVQDNEFNFYFDGNADWLEMIYGNKAFSMITILPREGKTIENIISGLNNTEWNNAIQGMRPANISLQLPRFKTECNYLLNEKILPDMGMNLPFTEEADFSGISNTPTFISKVIHKTYLDVNEEGTEAAAVTATEMEITSIAPDKQVIGYNVNKPFIFAIRERSTGIIMFIGKIGKP